MVKKFYLMIAYCLVVTFFNNHKYSYKQIINTYTKRNEINNLLDVPMVEYFSYRLLYLLSKFSHCYRHIFQKKKT